jgi:hypothetical protein
MKFLVIDIGKLHVSTAKRLADDGNEVMYYCPWYEAYPKFKDYAPGMGVSGLTNVIDFGSAIEKSDVIVFPDVGMGKFANYLRGQGKTVFGAGLGEMLELDRKRCNEVFDQVGIARPKTWHVKGVDKAIELIDSMKSQKTETNQNADGKYFVKLNIWRGSGETFPVQNTEDAKIMFDGLKQSLGPYESAIDITIQQKIEGIECGADYFFDGEKFVMPGMWGFESGASYVGKISSDLKIYEKDLNRLVPFLKRANYRGAFSFEGIFDGKRVYWIDSTCFDEETEVLTKDGWKYWKDVVKDDEICCLNPNGYKVFYEKPRALIKYEHDGEMIEIRSDTDKNAMSVKVTPNHEMYVRRQLHTEYEFIKADSLPGGCKIPRTGIWDGVEYEYIRFDGYTTDWVSGKGVERSHEHKEVVVDAEAWFRFLGIYLSDGSTGGRGKDQEHDRHVTISQVKYVDEFREIIEDTGLEYHWYEPNFQINSCVLARELEVFGNKPDRFVPDYVKNASAKLINAFLDGYCLGDGSRRENGSRRFYTASKRVADDLQELLLKVGSLGVISLSEKKGTIAKFGDKEYERNYDMYWVSERLYKKEYIVEKSNVKRVPYKGMVYCAEVSTHVMFVRRYGDPYWCGNCRFPMPLGMMYVTFAKDFGKLISDVARGQAKDSQLPEGKYLSCMEVSSDEGMEKWLPLNGGKHTQFLRYMVKDDKKYHVPGIQMLGAVCGEGDSMYAAQEDAVNESENLSVFYASFNKNFVDDIIEKYVDPMEQQGVIFEKGENRSENKEVKESRNDNDVFERMSQVEGMLNDLW